jgi:hypothetical protein
MGCRSLHTGSPASRGSPLPSEHVCSSRAVPLAGCASCACAAVQIDRELCCTVSWASFLCFAKANARWLCAAKEELKKARDFSALREIPRDGRGRRRGGAEQKGEKSKSKNKGGKRGTKRPLCLLPAAAAASAPWAPLRALWPAGPDERARASRSVCVCVCAEYMSTYRAGRGGGRAPRPRRAARPPPAAPAPRARPGAVRTGGRIITTYSPRPRRREMS